MVDGGFKNCGDDKEGGGTLANGVIVLGAMGRSCGDDSFKADSFVLLSLPDIEL